MSIFKKIISNITNLTKDDFNEWVIPELLIEFEPTIKLLASKIYNTSDKSSLKYNAVIAMVAEDLEKSILTFLDKKHFEKPNADSYLQSYMGVVLKGFYKKKSNEDNKRIHSLICPGCRYFSKSFGVQMNSFVSKNGSSLNCAACSDRFDSISDRIKTNPSLSLESNKKLSKTFINYSKKGYKCLDCLRFIPESLNAENGIMCPYPDCAFFGQVSELSKMDHPFVLVNRMDVSLDAITQKSESSNNKDLYNILANENLNIDSKIEISETYDLDFKLLSNIIDEQISYVKKTSYPGTRLQKTLMFEAYKKVLEKSPEDMVSYLIHKNKQTDSPIQSRIFQEYAGLVQDALPYTIEKDGENYEVVSILDPKISLFDGVSIFEAEVKNGVIPNNTKENYIGGKKFKDYGPCFIGYLKDVVDLSTSKSLMDKVKEYSFVRIKMDESILPGTKVQVTHYRIPSHYEMKSLVYLQRARKKIVSKIDLKTKKVKQ